MLLHDGGDPPHLRQRFGTLPAGEKRLRFEPADGLHEPVDGLQERLQFAGQDKADPQSMRSAIYAAIDIVEHRRAWAEWSRNPLQRAEREKGGRDVSVKDLPQTEKED